MSPLYNKVEKYDLVKLFFCSKRRNVQAYSPVFAIKLSSNIRVQLWPCVTLFNDSVYSVETFQSSLPKPGCEMLLYLLLSAEVLK